MKKILHKNKAILPQKIKYKKSKTNTNIFKYIVFSSPVSAFIFIYLHILKTCAFAELFKIDRSYFDLSSVSGSEFDGFVSFYMFLGGNSFVIILLLTIFVFLFIIMSFEGLVFQIDSWVEIKTNTRMNRLKNIFIKSSVFKESLKISILIFMVFILGYLYIVASSQIAINNAMNTYVIKHPTYCCQVEKNGVFRNNEFIVASNSNIPYDLYMNERGIWYKKPGESESLMHGFTIHERRAINAFCSDIFTESQLDQIKLKCQTTDK